jgi:3-phenylpropionate/cinnamic acid dioxygenase small subunit
MIPPVRTTHVLGNFEMWSLEVQEVRARASFIIDAVNKDRRRVLSGWIGYSLIDVDHQWRIAVKQINLIDADQPQGNNSFFL